MTQNWISSRDSPEATIFLSVAIFPWTFARWASRISWSLMTACSAWTCGLIDRLKARAGVLQKRIILFLIIRRPCPPLEQDNDQDHQGDEPSWQQVR